MHFIHSALLAFVISTSVNAKALRQYHPHKSLDVCGNIKSDFELSGRVLGKLDLCLCVSGVASHLATHPVLKSAVRLYGESPVTAKVISLVCF